MFNYDKLAALIDESGKSKAYLCRKVGKPEYYLRDVIRQKNKIPQDVQEILAAELNVTVDYLNDIEDEKSPAPEGAERIPNYDKLTGTNRAIVDTMIAQLLAAQSNDQ